MIPPGIKLKDCKLLILNILVQRIIKTYFDFLFRNSCYLNVVVMKIISSLISWKPQRIQNFIYKAQLEFKNIRVQKMNIESMHNQNYLDSCMKNVLEMSQYRSGSHSRNQLVMMQLQQHCSNPAYKLNLLSQRKQNINLGYKTRIKATFYAIQSKNTLHYNQESYANLESMDENLDLIRNRGPVLQVR